MSSPIIPVRKSTAKIPKRLVEKDHIHPMQSNAKTSGNLSRASNQRPPTRTDRPMRPTRKGLMQTYEGTGY